MGCQDEGQRGESAPGTSRADEKWHPDFRGLGGGVPGQKKADPVDRPFVLVAGSGFEPLTFRL